MILMRLSGLEGMYCGTKGDKQYKYDAYATGDTKAGWFPIESMNFGFNAKSESTAGGAATGNSKTNQQGNTAGQRGAVANSATNGTKKEGNESFTTISVSKFVDGATTELMRLAMEDRIKTKSDKENMRTADFHFVDAVMVGQNVSPKEFLEFHAVYPYMLITLESVLIKGWSINASGDDRPTETLEVWYDKAAMQYWRTIDGKTWTGGDVAGWNQTENKPWPKEQIASLNNYFAPPKHQF